MSSPSTLPTPTAPVVAAAVPAPEEAAVVVVDSEPADITAAAAGGGGTTTAAGTVRYDGMRREWNFTVSLRHKAAAAHLQLIPMWKSVFVDAESAAPQLLAASQYAAAGAGTVASKHSVPPPVPAGTFIPWYGYEDVTSAIQAYEEEGGGAGAGAASSPQRGAVVSDETSNEFGLGEQLSKTVRLYYSTLPPYITDEKGSTRNSNNSAAATAASQQADTQKRRECLEAFCKQSVQFILQSDDHVVSIDGETDLHKLCLGNKLNCKEKLGGSKSFSFRYHISDKKNMRQVYGYAIGTVAQGPVANPGISSDFAGGATTAANLRAHAVEKVDSSSLPCIGYLTTVACAHEEELNVYVSTGFARHFCAPSKLQLGRHDIVYKPCTYSVLAEQQLLFGELDYFDRDAALSFTIPMHPMNLRPDFSPIQTVGVGSVACMTSEVLVYQKLCDDNLEEDILGVGGDGGGELNRLNSITSLGSEGRSVTGDQQQQSTSNTAGGSLPKHKSNPVTLFLDVERVVKMGYPAVMSISQYAQLKAERLQNIFRNVTTIGEPLHIDLGPRPGRSTTVTFNYEGGTRGHANGSVKAILVSTLVGNLGVTAVYFTPLGHGLFDAHLYLFQHLLRNITFFGERQLRSKFSRFTTQNFRLTEQDIGRVYGSVPAGERGAMDQHIKALQASTDGKVDSAKGTFLVNPRTLVAVPVAGFSSATGPQATTAASGHNRTVSDDVAVVAGTGGVTSPADGGDISAQQGVGGFDPRHIPVSNVPRLVAMMALHQGGLGDDENDATGSPEPFHPDCTANGTIMEDDDAAGTSNTTGGLVPMVEGGGIAGGSNDTPMFASLRGGMNSDPSAADYDGDGGSDGGSTNVGDDETIEILGADTEGGGGGGSGLGGGGLDSGIGALTNSSVEAAKEAADRELVNNILANDDTNSYFGPSLRDVYVRCCETCGGCRPNSYLYNKLPLNSRFTNSVEELDLTSNYVGHQGFQAILNFIEYLPRLKILIFDDMGLDNTDVKNLVESILDRPQTNQHLTTSGGGGDGGSTAATNNGPTSSPAQGGANTNTISAHPAHHSYLSRVSLCNNSKITLPATKHLTRLIRLQRSIHTLQLSGTSLGDTLAKRLEQEAQQNAPATTTSGGNSLPAGVGSGARVNVESHPYQREEQ